ncbi:MAG: LptF/LptG family permease [Mariprofundus sp.]|nr:LptF/LptG family permease [Mariprofundus sp.]
MLTLTLPYFLLLTVPMAFFLSMQNTITNLQQNSEMDVMRASGLSYTRIFRSFFVLVLLLWISLTYASMILLPQGQLGFNNILAKVYAMKGVITFSPQRFTHGFDGITVYVDGEDKQGAYRGVILEDHRGGVSVIYTAESAQFDMTGNQLQLSMSKGVRLEGKGGDQRMLAFDKYKVSIPVSAGNWKQRHSGDHVTMMTPQELWQALGKDDPGAVAEWNRRWLLPTMVLVLFFFALPFSLARKRSGKAGSMIAGIALLVMIYNLQLMLHRQVNLGAFPGWTMWAEQGSLLLLGIFLWQRAEADHLPKVFSQAGEWGYLLHQYVMHKLGHRLGKS